MLVIRLQRTGRKGHAMFRIVVQDSRRTPQSGKVIDRLGSYDPHAKKVILDKEKAQKFLDNGAQPSERAVTLLEKEGIKMPKWVVSKDKKERATRNPEKRRSTTPKEEAPAEVEEVKAEESAEEEKSAEAESKE